MWNILESNRSPVILFFTIFKTGLTRQHQITLWATRSLGQKVRHFTSPKKYIVTSKINPYNQMMQEGDIKEIMVQNWMTRWFGAPTVIKKSKNLFSPKSVTFKIHLVHLVLLSGFSVHFALGLFLSHFRLILTRTEQ